MEQRNRQAPIASAVARTWNARWRFLIAFLVILFLTFSLLVALDWVPDAASTTATSTPPVVTNSISPNVADALPTSDPEDPVKIEIPEINLSATISNPTTTDVDALDNYLLTGAVRYPTSAELGEDGNVVLFGHSSYLPIVHNLAYKTFDGIQDLKPGDTITVYSSDKAYTYAVDGVQEENVDSNQGIPLTMSGQELTLATCNSFATKSDRFVVTAHFVESHPVSS